MAVKVEIKDSKFGTGNRAAVTSRGQVVTGPISFNEPHFRSLAVINTAYNFVTPVAGRQFVIDGVIVASDKNVSSTNGAQIVIYEADSSTSTTASRDLLTLDIARLDRSGYSGLNLLTRPGIWLNAKTDDNTCNVTILGYYVDVNGEDADFFTG